MNYWLFQANPDRYRVADDLARGGPSTWNVHTRRSELAVGDGVVIWLSGSAAGVYARGHIIEEASQRPDLHPDLWASPDDGADPQTWRCLVEYDEILSNPVSRSELLEDLAFAGSEIIRNPHRGNPFRLSEQEWEAITARLVPSGPEGRAPAWVQDEFLLALDLYLREGLLDDQHPAVIELSDLLGRLPIHPEPRPSTFRNPNGVALRLANFASVDDDYPGVGMTGLSALGRQIWERFHNKHSEVAALAAAIRAALNAAAVPSQLDAQPADEEEEVVEEGRILYRRHRVRERDRRIVARKKASALKENGRLSCEVCDLVPQALYGDGGERAMECHHRTPLAEAGSGPTKLSDLALVCAACHRVLHGTRPWPTVEALRAIVQAARRITATDGRRLVP